MPRLGIDRAAGQLEALLVPRRVRLAAGLDPVLRGLDRDRPPARPRRSASSPWRVSSLSCSPLSRNCSASAGCIMRDDALVPPRAGEQADLDFRQAEARLRIVGGDAVDGRPAPVRSRRPARVPLMARDPSACPQVSMLAVKLRQLAAFLEQHLLAAASSPLRLQRLGVVAAHASPASVRSAPPQNASLPEVMTDALDRRRRPSTFSTMRAEFLDDRVRRCTFIERPGMSQVTSAMPSASTSSLKLAMSVLAPVR